jgi:thiol-disulfide isomerase/thioredoxin
MIGSLLLGVAWATEPALPEMRMGWRGANARLRVVEPEGEHLAPGAPVSGWVGVNGVTVEMETSTEGLAHGLGVALHGKGPSEVSGELSFSLCVDDGTLCRIVDVGFWGMTQGLRGNASLSVFAPKAPEHDAVGAEETPLDLEAAMARAVAEDKPLLLDFSATWCPPCNLLAAEVLHAQVAQSVLDGFVVVVFDSDRKESWEAKSRYKVGGYPTVVVARPDGSVLDRLEGYPGQQATLDWLQQAAGSERSLAELAAVAGDLRGPEAARAALRLAKSGHTDAAMAALAGAEDGVDARMAKLCLTQENEDGLWLAENAPGEMYNWVWFLLDGDEISTELQSAILQVMPVAMGQVRGADTAALAEWSAQWSSPPQQQIQYAMVAAMLEESLSGTPQLDRGLYTLLARMQSKAGRTEEALATLRGAVQSYPAEFTYHYALAGHLKELGRMRDALDSAYAASSFAYGDNLLRAVHREAELLDALGRNARAREIVSEVLAGANRPPEGIDVRTTRYLEKLTTLQAELTPAP